MKSVFTGVGRESGEGAWEAGALGRGEVTLGRRSFFDRFGDVPGKGISAAGRSFRNRVGAAITYAAASLGAQSGMWWVRRGRNAAARRPPPPSLGC